MKQAMLALAGQQCQLELIHMHHPVASLAQSGELGPFMLPFTRRREQ